MGIEYNIRCRLPVRYDAEAFLARLENPVDKNGWTAFTVSLEPNGFYFCDNCWSEIATLAFRRIIDEALLHSDSVTLEQL